MFIAGLALSVTMSSAHSFRQAGSFRSCKTVHGARAFGPLFMTSAAR
jgi:hypothetical protein